MAQYKTYQALVGDEDKNDAPTYDVLSINTLEERQNIIGHNRLVVIDNHTDWCGPCQTCAPTFANMAQKYNREGICKLVKENVEKHIHGLLNATPPRQ